MRTTINLWVTLLGCLLVIGCSSEKELDQQLQTLIEHHKLNQPFTPDSTSPSPLLADLGGQLFFSPDLSIDGSVACASCHHPQQAGTDGIALPIGIGGVDSTHIGQDRIDAASKANPDFSLQGLIPRNSPSVFNAALYRQRLFWDGRVQYQEDADHPQGKKVIAGFGAAQHNPSNYLQENLLQTQARMPLTSSFEMKGSHAPNRNSHEIEQDILHFLQSQQRWCSSFAKVFGIKPCNELITLNHVTKALAAFQATLVFTDSPFQRYIEGDTSALNPQQKRGAISFLTLKEAGGAGCVNCHRGKTFSNENFYNINIPPSGRGANNNGWDIGRHNVDKTAERFSFRVPILLNVAHTAPYFHNGIAKTLEDAIRFKQTAAGVAKPADPIVLQGIDYKAIRQTINEDFAKGAARSLLPEKLSETQISDIAAFLRSLSDDCLSDDNCLKPLVKDVVASPRERKASRPMAESSRKPVTNQQPVNAPQIDCSHITRQKTTSDNDMGFSQHNLDIGLTHKRGVGLIKKGWLIDVVNYASVSAVDLNHDCFDDLIFDAGTAGLVQYQQLNDGSFQSQPIAITKPAGAVNAIVMDVDGDYRQDLFIGNYGQSPAAIVFDFQHRSDDVARLTTLSGPVINATAGDINDDGYLDVVFGMWRSFSSMKQPHIFYNDGHGNLSAEQGFIQLRQHEKHVAGGDNIKRQSKVNIGVSDLTFTPNLVDMDNNGNQDLLLAADFFRSQVLKNNKGRFQDVTDKNVIDDTNGMGAAVGDFDNNGTMDWFVTSIVDKTAPGLSRGHRLYMNQGGGVFQQAPVVNKDIEWSWGACTADFNNDGSLDLFYISGYGEAMATATYESEAQQAASENFLSELKKYTQSRPTLLINNGNGVFSDQSQAFGLGEPLDGRGVACFDYQQDGDIDIVVTPLEGSPVLYRNNLNQNKNWIAMRFVGLPGNSEAFGTQVTVHTKQGKQYRQVKFENNFVSRNPAQLHFGLGNLDQVEKVEIKLPPPQQKVVELADLEINRLHVLYWSDLLQD